MPDPTDNPDLVILRKMIEGDANLRAALQQILGMQPWPYDDLVLRTPHCPHCGSRADMLVGQFVKPLAFCPNDDCSTMNWDPTTTAERLLATSKVMIERTSPDGQTRISEPHDPFCALATPGGGATCTCQEPA